VLARLVHEEFTRKAPDEIVQSTVIDPAPGAGIKP
jgi:hypothetical protein